MKKVLFILLLIIIPVFAQNVELDAIGLSGGAFWAQNGWDPGFAVEVNLDMGEVLDFVFLQPTVAFYQTKKNEKIYGVDNELTLSHVALGTKIIGYFTDRPKGPYFGAALNYHIISAEKLRQLELSNSAEVYTSNNKKVSMSVLSGYIQKFRRVAIFLEVRYTFVPNNFNHSLVTTGILFNL